jgi:hypothetical protein
MTATTDRSRGDSLACEQSASREAVGPIEVESRKPHLTCEDMLGAWLGGWMDGEPGTEVRIGLWWARNCRILDPRSERFHVPCGQIPDALCSVRERLARWVTVMLALSVLLPREPPAPACAQGGIRAVTVWRTVVQSGPWWPQELA